MLASSLEISGGRYLLLTNISKANNLRDLAYTAAAHGFVPIVVGERGRGVEENVMLEEQLPRIPIILRLYDLGEAVEYLGSRNVPIIGIEIMAESRSILDPGSLPESMALMPGNEGSGLSATQKAVCQSFVFVPQYSAGTASLNVNVATALVLHHATILKQH
jgi:tRNA G18 (ribose-2'-O)-methylase SpoU